VPLSVLTKSGNLLNAATNEVKLVLADAKATMLCVGAGVDFLSSEQRMAVTNKTIKARAQDNTGFPSFFILVVFGLTLFGKRTQLNRV
jgi:hypothetical protein